MLYALLLIIYFSLFVYLSYKKPHWAVFIIIAALPSYAVRFKIKSLPMTLLEGMILLLFIIWAIKKLITLLLKYRQNNTIKIFNLKFLIFKKFLNFLISNIRAVPIFLFILAASISAAVSPDKVSALGIWKAYFIEPILFLIVFIDVLKNAGRPQEVSLHTCHPDQATEERVEGSVIGKTKLSRIPAIHFTASALAIPALYISLFAIYQKFTGAFVPPEFWQPGYHRVTSFFSYPNAIGLLLAPIVMILLGAAITPVVETHCNTSLRKWFYFFTAILSLAAIIFAKSEGALIALIAGIFIFAFLYNKKLRLIAGIIIFLILSASAGIYIKYGKHWNILFNKTNLFELDNACITDIHIPPPLRRPVRLNRRSGGGQGEVFCKLYQKLTLQDVSGTIRRNMWQETLTMLKEKTLFGAGLAGYQKTMETYHTKNYVEIYLYPHNIILNFWSETGLGGLIAFIWLIILFYYYGLYSMNNTTRHPEGAEPSGRRISWLIDISHLFHSPLDYSTAPSALDCSQNNALLEHVRQRRIIALSILCAMSILLIHGLVDVPYFKNDLALLFWVIWGMMIII
ncbi:MAG: O-antigen ligase family protein [bacterium]